MRDSAPYDSSKYGNGPVTFELRRSVQEDNFLGDRLPDRLGNGPVETRKSTDSICLIIYCLFFLLLVILSIVFLFGTNNKMLYKPMDSESRVCGQDPEVKDFPFLYMLKFSANYVSVCVKECPRFDYNQIKYNSDGQNSSLIQPLYFENYTSVVPRSYIYGEDDPAANTDADKFQFDAGFANGYFTASQFNAYLDRLSLKCSTNLDVPSCARNPSKGINYYDSRPYTSNVCFPLTPKLMKHLGVFGDISHGVFEDLDAAFWMIMLSLLIAFVLGLVFLFCSSFMITCLIWVQIALFVLLCMVIGIACIVLAFGNYDSYLESKDVRPYLVSKAQGLRASRWWVLFAGIGFIILGVVVLLVAIYYKTDISRASVILKYSSTVIMRNLLVVLLGVLCFLAQIFFLMVGLWLLVSLYTSGDVIRDTVLGYPLPRFSVGFFRWVLILLVLFAMYWTATFINNLADFVTSGTAVNFYFARASRFIPAFKDTLAYHLGSVALGSLILAPISLVQLAFGWLYDVFTATGLEGEPNAIQKCCGKICCCCFTPYKKYFLRVTETAFSMIYLTSANFCPSSKETYYLLMSYKDKVGSIDFVTTFYKLITVLLVSTLNTYLFYGIFVYFDYYVKNVSNPFVPCFVIFLTTLLITIIFMNIYTTVVQTCIICYLVELDVNRVPRIEELNQLIQKSEDLAPPKAANRYNPLK